MPVAPWEAWIQAVTESAGEIAALSLGFEASRVTGRERLLPLLNPSRPGMVGAYISVLSPEHALNLGLLADAPGCEGLAKALLGMDAEESLPPEDVADALRELVNILAGGVKRRLAPQECSLQLGLPLVLQGHVAVTDQMEADRVKMDLGPIAVELHLIRNRTGLALAPGS